MPDSAAAKKRWQDKQVQQEKAFNMSGNDVSLICINPGNPRLLFLNKQTQLNIFA